MERLSLKDLECILTLSLGHLPEVPQVHLPGPTIAVCFLVFLEEGSSFQEHPGV